MLAFIRSSITLTLCFLQAMVFEHEAFHLETLCYMLVRLFQRLCVPRLLIR